MFQIRLAVPGRGAVTGQIGVVHVVRAPYTADYISFDASRASGDLGGRISYADPMLVTLYGTVPQPSVTDRLSS